jgi:mannosyltransferase OCH1-like enzyme
VVSRLATRIFDRDVEWRILIVASASLLMNKRRAFYVCLAVLALFLLGTVVVLSSVTYYLAIDPQAYLSELDVPYHGNNTRSHSQHERIPRIIHQTWKTETLPPRWQPISQACRDMMPD